MANKTISIKSATDKELDELITRLRKEANAQQIIRDIKRMSTKNDPYQSYEERENSMSVSTEEPIESLYHFGIPGMKWGVRRSRTKGTISTKKPKPDTRSEDYKRSKKIRKKKLSQMSNTELKEINNRLQLEKQYKELTKRKPLPGKKLVGSILAESSKELAKDYTKKYMSKGLETLIREMNDK